MALKTQTDFGESLELTVTTQVMKISGSLACFVKFYAGDNLIRKSFKGFAPEQFKWADESAFALKRLTGATIVTHATDECDRQHQWGHKCNTSDSDLNAVEKKFR